MLLCGCHHSFDAINWESNKIILPRPGPALARLTMEITDVTLTQHLVQHSTWVIMLCVHTARKQGKEELII